MDARNTVCFVDGGAAAVAGVRYRSVGASRSATPTSPLLHARGRRRSARWHMKQVSDPKKSAAVPAEEVKAGARDAKAGAESAVSGLRDMADEVWHRVETLPDRVRERIESFDAKAFADDSLAFWKQVWDNTITGEWFNRGELYFAIQLGLLLLILRDPGALDPLVGFMLGPATLAVGLYVVVRGIVDLGAENLVPWLKPPKSARLKTDGMYALMRHPIYSGLVLTSLGYSAVTHSPERLVLTCALFYFLTRKAAEEEKYLLDKFGKDYEAYAATVKAFIPNVF